MSCSTSDRILAFLMKIYKKVTIVLASSGLWALNASTLRILHGDRPSQSLPTACSNLAAIMAL